MTTQAVAFMLVVWGVVIGMTAYCFFRLMTTEQDYGQ